ncbi:hypothetical protein V8F33_013656 [Rhypophila sp. PSN 637]
MEAHNEKMLEFITRYQDVHLNLAATDQLIQDLLVFSQSTESELRDEKEQLIQQVQDLRADLSADVRSRRDLHRQLHEAEIRVHVLEQEVIFMKNSNPYVVILIDGDGLLFKDNFISQGREGGEKAAHALRAAILKECNEHAKNTEVVATLFSSLAGLAKAMRRDGTIGHEDDLRDFTSGFTQGKAMFNVKDVGHGKEREIKDSIKWHLRNINCKQVILGISHDAGYAPFLTELFQDDEIRDRLCIVEGFPTTRDLVKTGARILNFNETVFRKDKLVVERPAERTTRNPTPTSISISPGVIGSGIIGGGIYNSGSSDRIPTPATSNNSTPATKPATIVAAAAPTYARAIGNASPPPQITLPIQPRPVTNARPSQHIVAAQQAAAAAAAAKAPPVAWNPGRRGVDPPIQVSQTALDNIKKRKDSNKLCNNHYLRGPCAKGDSCCFEHKYKPTKDELNAIAFLTRLNPCAMGQDCEIVDCIYGHHCPSVRDGWCTHPFCKFEKEDHPPGTKFKTRLVTE